MTARRSCGLRIRRSTTGSRRCWTSRCGRTRRCCVTSCSCTAWKSRRSRPSARRTAISRTQSRRHGSASSSWSARRANLMNRRGARIARLLAVAALLLSSAGCARLFGSYDIAPNGLAAKEDRLRHMLAAGQAASAYDAFGESWKPPEVEVLRALYQGVLAYYAGEYEESARVMDISCT